MAFLVLLWVFLSLVFVVDHSSLVLGCMAVTIFVFSIATSFFFSKLSGDRFAEAFSLVGAVIVTLLFLSAIASVLRFWGFTLERLSPSLRTN